MCHPQDKSKYWHVHMVLLREKVQNKNSTQYRKYDNIKLYAMLPAEP